MTGIRRIGLGNAVPLLAGLACALSLACGGEPATRTQPEAPSPAAVAPARSQESAPTPTPLPPTSTPAPTPTIAPTATPATPRAPGFSLVSGVGSRVTLDHLLDGHDAVVLVFYRGFF